MPTVKGHAGSWGTLLKVKQLKEFLFFYWISSPYWGASVDMHQSQHLIFCLFINGGGSVMLWVYFAASCSGTLYKVGGIVKKENYLQILQRHLRWTARWLKLEHIWVLQQDDGPKRTSKLDLNR